RLKPDLIVVCGWQRLICKEILTIPSLGTIGFHSSLLPKYRGRAPVNWAILLGERETGITMFYLTPEADTGDIIAQKVFPILFNDDCGTIYEKAAKAGAEMIKEYLPQIKNGTAPAIHNPSASYPAYPKRIPEDGRIDFNRSALDIYNFVRSLTRPYPGAFYYDEHGHKVIVWRIEIVMDNSRIQPGDILFETRDYKIRIVEYNTIDNGTHV
ncbi:MAG: methionyl-tRNA formyltransferase, partial [bacterium]